MQVVGYIRVSTDDQAQNGFSLPYQKQMLENYCKINGHELITIFEEDYSAKDFDRPTFNKLVEYLKVNRGRVDLLLFTKWDRFSRNQEGALGMIRRLQKLGVMVSAVEQPLDLSIPDNKLMLAMYLAIPEVENDKNSQRTTDGMHRGNKEGCWMGTAPFGYSNWRNTDGKSTLQPNASAVVVKAAFDMYSQGIYSMEEVRKALVKDGMKLTKNAFNSMLRNVVYTGRVLVKAHKQEAEDIVIGLHEPIISSETFDEVQAIIGGKKKKKLISSVRSEIMPLRNRLTCPICNKNLTGSGSKGRNGIHYYYHCTTGCGFRCRVDKANDAFENLLNSFSFREEVVRLYHAVLNDVFKEKHHDRAETEKSIDQEIESIERRLENVFDKFSDDQIDQQEYSAAKKRYGDKLTELFMKKANFGAEDKNAQRFLKYGLSLLTDLRRYYVEAPLPVKQKIIGSIFPEKLVFDKVEYRTTKMNEFISLLTNSSNGLGVLKKEKADISVGLSCLAPPSGLEPETL